MIRFALLLLMSFALSSQAVGAVKWSNSTGECGSSEKRTLTIPKKESSSLKSSSLNNANLNKKLGQRRSINPTVAWHTNYIFEKPDSYKLGWTLARKSLGQDWGSALKLAAPHWNYNFTSTPKYSNWLKNGHSKFLTDISWSHDDEYGKTLALDITHSDFAQALVNEIRLTNKESKIDGVMLDWWHLHHQVPWKNKLHKILPKIAKVIEEELGTDFLILGNVNWEKDAKLVKNLNGVFLELYKSPYETNSGSYSCNEIKKIEQLINFHQKNLRPPKIIALNPWRITDRKLKSPSEITCDRLSPENLRYSRLFAAMSAVLAENGYIEYSDNNPDFADTDHRAAYYPVYDTDVGKPISGSINLEAGISMKYFEKGIIAFNRTSNDAEFFLNNSKIKLPTMDAVFLDYEGNSVNKGLGNNHPCYR